MSSHRPWYKHYPADFIAGTVAMTAEEKGAYIVVLNLIYDRGAPLVDDPQWLARVVGCSTRRWKQLRESLIEHGKVFITEDGKLFNKRAGQQLESDAKESEIFRESGAKGGKKAAEIRRNSSDNSGLVVNGLVQNSEHIPEARSQKKYLLRRALTRRPRQSVPARRPPPATRVCLGNPSKRAFSHPHRQRQS
jgi:uncharacterized protein YdaU (DUF1376 family)